MRKNGIDALGEKLPSNHGVIRRHAEVLFRISTADDIINNWIGEFNVCYYKFIFKSLPFNSNDNEYVTS